MRWILHHTCFPALYNGFLLILFDYLFPISYFSHVVNLLTNMPSVSYEELLTPIAEELGTIENKDMEYDGKNMEAIAVLLEFLNHRLDKKDYDKVSHHCLWTI